MARVLVVDDSDVDRQLIGGLLANDPDLDVVFASDGDEALASVEKSIPDLILTDLVMPGKGGLELVAELRESHPFVPVILVTSKGSEEMAVRALQAGAASYVPKRTLAEDLAETVETALSAAAQRRSRSELMKAMRSHHCSFELGNRRALFVPLVGYLQESLASLGLFDEGWRTRIGVALEEALVNASEHGNLELGSELRQDDREAYVSLLAERQEAVPYCERKIRVEVELSRDIASFAITDEGSGFDWRNLPDPTDPKNLLKVSGRGVMLMKTFMDEVVFNEVGNEVTMVKRRTES